MHCETGPAFTESVTSLPVTSDDAQREKRVFPIGHHGTRFGHFLACDDAAQLRCTRVHRETKILIGPCEF
jgi:hypothetical protein